MLSGFQLFHKPTGDHGDLRLPEGFFHFGTCIRSIVLSMEDYTPDSLRGYMLFEEEQAYQFLLEIICGMHSPLLGETEILGQFKVFSKQTESDAPKLFQAIIQALNSDAKVIRKDFLQNLGCHSYGSLLRKQIGETQKALCFVGAGQLVQEILPWFDKKAEPVRVWTRDVVGRQHVKSLVENMNLESFEEMEAKKNSVLVIAAPVGSTWLKEKLQLELFDSVYDLRGTSDQDPIEHADYKPLKSLFELIESNRSHAKKIKNQALDTIHKMSVQRFYTEKPRPFGWDDLWTYS